jgi:hypothetical protein
MPYDPETKVLVRGAVKKGVAAVKFKSNGLHFK